MKRKVLKHQIFTLCYMQKRGVMKGMRKMNVKVDLMEQDDCDDDEVKFSLYTLAVREYIFSSGCIFKVINSF